MLGFGGGLYDSDTGLVHFGYREYDPVIGRFISPDPLGYEGGDVDVYGFCLGDPINFVDRDGLKNRTQADDKVSESEDQESRSDESSKRKTDSITGMDMRKELQALKKRNDKQESETESEEKNSESEEEEGALEKIYDGIGEALTKGGKATIEATSKAGEAIINDPKILGTTVGAAILPAVIAGGVLGGKDVLAAGAAGVRRFAPHLEKGVSRISKVVKRGRSFIRDAESKADIGIRTSKIGEKHKLNLEKVGEAATGLIDNQPPTPTLGGAVSIGKAIIEAGVKYIDEYSSRKVQSK